MVGRISPWKGHDVALRATAAARRRGVAVRLLIAGAPLFGEQAVSNALRRLAGDLDLTGQVVWLGHVDDVPELLRAVDVVLHASVIPEPFGQVVVEAMAAGRAVVAAEGGGPAEIVTDGVDGLLVPPGDVEGLAAALVWLAGSAERRERLGRAARLRAARYVPARVAAEEMAVYERLVAARRTFGWEARSRART
jgi:glycosyltransferase involved in cell wall biosynthesis